METFVAALVFFLVAVAAMGIGVMIQGKVLNGSCSGRLPDGTKIGDCLCEKKERGECTNQPELYQIDLGK